MTYPKARKLPSGSWTCRVRIRGNDKSFTRPTKQLAVAAAMAYKAGLKTESEQLYEQRFITVEQALEKYIDARENILSPSTIRGYRIIQRHRFTNIRHLYMTDISQDKWQRIINAEAKLCAPKTLKNAWRLMKSAILESTGCNITVRLPQIPVKDLPYLTPEQIPVFLQEIKGKRTEIPALLALTGLRKSEILALDWSDFDLNNRIVRVSGAAVLNDDNKLVKKPTNKNSTSRRLVPMIPPLYDAIKRQGGCQAGQLIKKYPDYFYRDINKICKKAGLPQIGVHGLRRSFASLAYHLHLPPKVTMRIGGWSNDQTMLKIYTKISERDIVKESESFLAFFDNQNSNNDNGNGDGEY